MSSEDELGSDVESDANQVAIKWSKKASTLAGAFTEATQRQNANVSDLISFQDHIIWLISLVQKLERQLIHQALHYRYQYEEFARDGVSPKHLVKFQENPKEYGPKCSNTRLDKNRSTTADLMENRWNQALVALLACKAADIAGPDGANGYFGKIKWKRLIWARIYHVVLNEIQSRLRMSTGVSVDNPHPYPWVFQFSKLKPVSVGSNSHG
jgi:hypothetical protein